VFGVVTVEDGQKGVAVKPEPAGKLAVELGAGAGYFEEVALIETVEGVVDEEEGAVRGREVTAIEAGRRAQLCAPGVALFTEERGHGGQPPLWGPAGM
jgi:hypothetical protein